MQDHTLDITSYMPHGHCYLWQSDLLLLHVVSDALIVLSYYSIPFALLYVLKKRNDIPFSWIYWQFGVFILLCGTTHLLSIWNIWIPDYWLSGAIKAATAASSIVTAILIWPLIPKVLAIPSQKQLLAANSALAQEIDSHKKTEQELRKLSLALQFSSSIVVIADPKTRIEYCNPAFYKLTGYCEQDVLGQKTNLLKSDLTSAKTYKDLWTTLRAGSAWHGEFLNRKKNGELFWCLESITPVLDEHHNVTHFVSIMHDINDRKDSEEVIRHMAYYDPLTDLPNRTLFNERLDQAIGQAKRYKTRFAVIYLDLDHFKSINDTLGHLIGDKLLIEVGKRITLCLREQEIIARLGGDEFALIGINLRTPADAGDIARRVIDTINQAFFIDDHQLFIGTSLGISVYPTDGSDGQQLLKHADDALYLAKQRGRNTFEFYNATANAQSLRRQAIENLLRLGLARNEFSLVYQAKIDLHSNRIVGAEALLRWLPEIGPVAPEEFVPIAEDIGLIGEIGEWVLRSACRDYMGPALQARSELKLAVNIAKRQFKQTDLLTMIDRVLSETGLPASRLEFEISESILMERAGHAEHLMQGLKQRGIRLTVDDFGTGLSSLRRLKRFPVDTLTIAPAFVNDICNNPDDACIVRSLIGLAHGLNLRVEAKGVETEQQRDILTQHHCDRAQGHFFRLPLPIEEFSSILD